MTPALALLVPLLTAQAGGGSDAGPVHRIEIQGDKGSSSASAPSSNAPPTMTAPANATSNPTSISTSSSTGSHASPDGGTVTATPGQTDPRTVAQLTARVSDLENQLRAAQNERAQQETRIKQLEQQLAAERAKREQADRDPSARAPALSGATSALQGADQALASGSAEDVSAAISRAQALAAESASQAGANRSEGEAALAGEAQRWLASSQDALSRGDLYQARQAVQRALDAAARARALNATAAGAGTGASAAGSR